MRLSGTKASTVSSSKGLGDQLYDLGGARPTLDLNFANNDSLADSITGKTLPSFTRASTGTYVDGDGLIQTAAVDTPRFDHDPATGESLGLLIEEARTNLLIYSEEFNTSPWQKINTSITTNVVESPDGSFTADKLVDSATNSEHTLNVSPSVTSGKTYTASIFVKAAERTEVKFGFTTTNFSSPTRGDFDLTTGSAVETYNTITDVGNGWYRITATNTATSSGTANVILNLLSGGNNVYTGDGASGVYVWGAQLEQGSFPTSYIPTSGSTVTRAADVAEITGADFAKTNLLQYSERFEQSVWSPGNPASPTSSVIPNVHTAPDGTVTADKLVPETSSGFHFCGQTITTAAGTYTASAYFKQAGYQYAALRIATNSDADRFCIVVDLNSGSITSTNSLGSPSGTIYSVQSIGNGWYRLNLSQTHSSGYANLLASTSPTSNPAFTAGLPSFTGDGTSGVYVWGAQLEEGDVLTDYTPSVESFTSRASSATYVDDTTGLIKTTPVNLVTYSEELDNVAWTKVNGSVSANVNTSPIGDQTADKWVPNTSNNFHFIKTTATGSSEDYTYSVYAKQSGYRYLLINTSVGSTSGNAGPVVDLQDGVVVDNFTATYPTSVTDAGNGWWRIALTFTGNGAAITVDHNPLPTSTIASYTGDGTSGVLLWGAQLEKGSTATPYIKTTSTISGAARYENGELILEEARTNLLTSSEEVDTWFLTRVTVTANNAYSPTGELTADTVIENTDNNSHLVKRTLGVESGKTYTASVFVKSAGRTRLKFGFTSANFPSSTRGAFDLDAGTAVESYNTITDFGNGWYRLTATSTADGTGNAQLNIDLTNDNGATNYTGDGTSGLILWGGQVEEGAFASSYIATDSSAVTRAADVSTSALGVDSFYNQSEGTMFAESDYQIGSSGARFVGVNDGTINNRHEILANGGLMQAFQVNSGVVEVALSRTAGTKAALAYALNDYSFSVDSQALVNDTAATPPAVTQMSIGNWYNNSGQINGHIKRLAYFNTRLPDATLQNITS